MTYSIDFRKRVFAVKAKKGLTFEQTSERFDLPIRTLFRWQQRLEPCTTRHKPATKIDMDALKKDVEIHPDKFQWERAMQFKVSPAAICVALKRLEISYKKNTAASQSKRSATSTVHSKYPAL